MNDPGEIDRFHDLMRELLGALADAPDLPRTSRGVRRDYGSHLIVRFASRLDQLHFKLYALADRGGGKHEADPSEPHRDILVEALAHLGVEDADLGP